MRTCAWEALNSWKERRTQPQSSASIATGSFDEAVERGQTKGHLLSVFGGDSEIRAIWAAVADGAVFTVEGPGIPRLPVASGSEAQRFRGMISIPGRKHLTRHLIAISEQPALTRAGGGREGKRTILCDGDPGFVL
jgi:hypothetical protein